jgi:ribosome maturation factor RimP
MRYTPRVADEVFDSIETVVKGFAMSLVELSVSRQKSGVQVIVVVCKGAGRETSGGTAAFGGEAFIRDGAGHEPSGGTAAFDGEASIRDGAGRETSGGTAAFDGEAFIRDGAGRETSGGTAVFGGEASIRDGAVSIDDCSRVHRAILPRLELAFPGRDIYIEVSSPGIERRIKDGAEFVHYIGRPVSCYRTDISDWTSGILERVCDTHIVIKGRNGMTSLSYDIIAKAKLASFTSVVQETQLKKEAAV